METAALKTIRQYSTRSNDWAASKMSAASRISNISTLSDAFTCITELCNEHDYDHFIMANMPRSGDDVIADDIVISNLPLYMMNDLIDMELLTDWSILTELQHTSAPFLWTPMEGIKSVRSPHRDQSNNKSVSHSATDLMFIDELETEFLCCFQMATRSHRRVFNAFFSSSQSVMALDPTVIYTTQLIFDQIETLAEQRIRNTFAELNKRELECLSWAAAGKTSGEISQIVTLSEHTVNHYLNSCCKKLDCVNRTQAVAKAVRLGVIE